MTKKPLLLLILLTALVGCTSNTPTVQNAHTGERTVCDTYLMMSMCVQDLVGDGTVDLVYFTDTDEVFMYQQGLRRAVAEVKPFHRCAVPLDKGMQSTTNRILNRKTMALSEEIEITRELIANYAAAKPSIDACNERFERDEVASETVQHEEFHLFEPDWDDE